MTAYGLYIFVTLVILFLPVRFESCVNMSAALYLHWDDSGR